MDQTVMHALRTPDQCRRRNNFGERLGRLVARVGRPLGLRYRLYRRHTQVDFPEIEIELPNLPPALDGFRIVQVTDLHRSGLTVEADFDRLFDDIARLPADMYAFTGDNVSYHAHLIPGVVERLGRLRASCGSFAVLGNHDYWEDANLTAEYYARAGVHLLVNAWASVEHRDARLAVAGLDDHCEGDPNFDAALTGLPDALPLLLLSHTPVAALDPRAARAGLVLSGHLHGGLINLPGLGPIRMPEGSPRALIQGYYRTEYTQVYISSGIGTSVVWFRFRARPEVPTFILTAGK